MNNLKVGDLALVIGCVYRTDLIGKCCEITGGLGKHNHRKMIGEEIHTNIGYVAEFPDITNPFGAKGFFFRPAHLMKISPDDTVKEKEKSLDHV